MRTNWTMIKAPKIPVLAGDAENGTGKNDDGRKGG